MTVTESKPSLRNARGDALAVDRVPVEVDRDAFGADDEAVPDAVVQVVHDLRARVSLWPQKTIAGTGAAEIVHSWVAGVGSSFPAGSTARTENTWARTPMSG